MTKIIVIDDDMRILRLIKKMLPLFEIDTFSDVNSVDLSTINQYELMLLDVMMPVTDGFTFCKKIRELYLHPIIFLTAKSDENSLIEGLTIGADDYIIKPFSMDELSARVQAHIRGEKRRNTSNSHILSVDEILLDFDACKVFVYNKEIRLTKTQYLICKTLSSNRGKVFSKEMIFEKVFPFDSDSQLTTISEHIRVIRKKFQDHSVQPIETVWGIGYVWR